MVWNSQAYCQREYTDERVTTGTTGETGKWVWIKWALQWPERVSDPSESEGFDFISIDMDGFFPCSGNIKGTFSTKKSSYF